MEDDIDTLASRFEARQREVNSLLRASRAVLVHRDFQQAARAIFEEAKGIIPICAKCKKIRDDQGYWQQAENYIGSHSEAEFSHGLCPTCLEEIEKEIPS